MSFDPNAFTEQTGIQLEQYPLDSCPVKSRRGETAYPYAGKSVWLTPSTPMTLTEAGIDLSVLERNTSAGQRGFEKLKRGMAQVVAGHDAPGLPQIWGAPDALSDWPTETVFHVYQIIISGEPPAAEGNASRAGSGGNSTPPSMAIVETTPS